MYDEPGIFYYTGFVYSWGNGFIDVNVHPVEGKEC